MIAKLTPELREALRHADGPLPIEDEQTSEVYYLVDEATLEHARQQADRQAIQEGIADMEAGRVLSLEELDRRLKAVIAQFGPQ
jgi:predicted transcriptional regulator